MGAYEDKAWGEDEAALEGGRGELLYFLFSLLCRGVDDGAGASAGRGLVWVGYGMGDKICCRGGRGCEELGRAGKIRFW